MWWAAPAATLCCLVLEVCSAACQTAVMVTIGQLVGSLSRALHHPGVAGYRGPVWGSLAATAGLFVLGPLTDTVANYLANKSQARYTVGAYDLAMEASVHPSGIATLEDTATAAHFDSLSSKLDGWSFSQGVPATWQIVTQRLSGVGAFAVLASWRWWAPFVGAAGWLVVLRPIARYEIGIFDAWSQSATVEMRMASYVRDVLVETSSAKEVRIFGLTDWLLGRYRSMWLDGMKASWRGRGRHLTSAMSYMLFGVATSGFVMAVLVHDAWRGAISLAILTTMAQAIMGLRAFGPMAGQQQTIVLETTTIVHELVSLRLQLGLPALPDKGHLERDLATQETGLHPRAAPQAATVELTDVTFTYPTRQDPTLADLTLQIPAGQSVAIVGVNGTGKSTLMKLLCGLYVPDSGRVLIDGRDPSADASAQRRVAIIFQDFVHYPLPLRDNVGFGSLSLAGDQSALEHALGSAGGSRLVDRLEHGWDTVLSPEFVEGTDLSGGQWQRVALARALIALDGGAGLLILDEPTAALDVRAEAALFERFLEVTRGATTILVSHRLSSVRRADRIIVIGQEPSGGAARVIEDGSHEELLAAGRDYAKLFRLQAARFARAGAGPGSQPDEANGDEPPWPPR